MMLSRRHPEPAPSQNAIARPRIILTAGKGGVGKSTFAAATAVQCAGAGLRTLLMSVDSAHNIGDLLRMPVGATPTPVAERLHALEVDINRELTSNWSAVIDFFRSMTANNPVVTHLVAEECAVLPGMEEVFGLMRLQTVAASGDFDVIVLDAPPTGDLLKFLRLPDVLQWFMERYHPFERGLLRRARPVAEAMNLPVPTDASLEEMEQWYASVRAASATLTDTSRVSVRLVMTPDTVGLAETRRAMNWTCLLGMTVDAVLVNKLLPPGNYPPALSPWASRQGEVLQEAERIFGAVPVLRAELQPDEVLGLEALSHFGAELYRERDAAALWAEEPPVQWLERGTDAELRVRLPFLKKDQFRLLASADGLVLHVGNQRRVIPLPDAVARRPMLRAHYEGEWLLVSYGPPA